MTTPSSATGPWKIGEIAERTGISDKTLRHYDEIGLLSPSQRGDNNYRLYSAADVEKLQRIVSLKELGMTLEQIQMMLAQPTFSPVMTLQMQVQKLKVQSDNAAQLLARLEGLLRVCASKETPTAEDLFAAIRLMTVVGSYHTPEQNAAIAKRREEYGDEKIRGFENEWQTLIAEAKAHMDKGTDPKDPDVRRIAKRWRELIDAFTGGDAMIEKNLKTMYEKEPAARHFGPDSALMAYVQKASEQ